MKLTKSRLTLHKMINRISISFLCLIASMLFAISVSALNISVSPNIENSCPGARVNAEMYFTSATLIVRPSDSFASSRPAFILSGTTDIQLWSGNGGSMDCTE